MATTPRKTTAPRTKTAPKAPVTRAATSAQTPAAAPATPAVVAAASPVVAGPVLKKRELIDRVVARSGVKKKDAKPAVEAALAVLGEALANGEELNLQPFGRMKINREKVAGNNRIIICKLRQHIVPPTSLASATATSVATPQAAE